jgi:hypothetical protein
MPATHIDHPRIDHVHHPTPRGARAQGSKFPIATFRSKRFADRENLHATANHMIAQIFCLEKLSDALRRVDASRSE